MSGTASKRPVPVPSNTSRPFWEAAKERRLVIQYDRQAKRWQFYPRAIGLDSGRRDLEWREVSGKGSVYSYTVTHIPTAGFEDKVPYALAIVYLDEGVRMLANVIHAAPDDVRIGMRVKVCWEEIGDDAVYFAFEPDVNS